MRNFLLVHVSVKLKYFSQECLKFGNQIFRGDANHWRNCVFVFNCGFVSNMLSRNSCHILKIQSGRPMLVFCRNLTEVGKRELRLFSGGYSSAQCTHVQWTSVVWSLKWGTRTSGNDSRCHQEWQLSFWDTPLKLLQPTLNTDPQRIQPDRDYARDGERETTGK